MEDLSKIDGIVIPSQANYFMIEIANGRTSKEITKTSSSRQYLLRISSKAKPPKAAYMIAIKRESENKLLLNALKRY